MIRTSVSLMVLLGCLLFVSKAMQQTNAQERRDSRPRTAPYRNAVPLRDSVDKTAGSDESVASSPPLRLVAPILAAPIVGEANAAQRATPRPSVATQFDARNDARNADLDDHKDFEDSLSAELTLAPAFETGDDAELGASGEPVQHDDEQLSAQPQLTPSVPQFLLQRPAVDESADHAERATSNARQSYPAGRRRPVMTQVLGTAEGLGTSDVIERSAADAGELPTDENLQDQLEETSSDVTLADDPLQSTGELEADTTDVPAGDWPSEESQSLGSETSPDELSPEMAMRRELIRNVLAYYLQRREAVEHRSPWGIMHALIAYGVDTEVTAGGRPMNAIAWLCWNGSCRGQRLMYTSGRTLQTRQGPGVQGHEGQFLAMLAQSKVMIDYGIRIDNQQFTVEDLVRHEQLTCRENTELTFKLIGLSHYLDTEATWKNRQGQAWDLQKLIQEELAQPVVGAACGGTHRLMGFSYAVRKREKSGLPVTGQWLRAQKYIDSYHEYTLRLQNPDGSLSTNWFRGPGNSGTVQRRLETTGHMLEWLVYSLPEDQLTSPEVLKTVDFLANLLWEYRENDWEIGPRGHALHALAMFDERVFGGRPGQRHVQLARHK